MEQIRDEEKGLSGLRGGAGASGNRFTKRETQITYTMIQGESSRQ